MRSSFLLAYFTIATHCFGAEMLNAPNMDAEVIDQIPIHEMACGPVALLNAYQFSSADWRGSVHKMSGSTVEKFNYLTKTYCSIYSRNSHLKRRWDDKNGIRPDDLTEAINEFHIKVNLPKVSLKRLFLKNKQSHEELLVELHTHIAQSLQHGFPPLLSVSRFARISSPRGGHRWSEVSSHFITLTSIPRELEANAQSFSFGYVDPWGGRKSTNQFIISESTFFANDITNRKDKSLRKNPTLILSGDSLAVGAGLVSSDTAQALTATHLIAADSAPTAITKP